MASFKAIAVMIAWTALVGYGLFALGAHEHFRNPFAAASIGVALLVLHMTNMTLYFKIAGERPFEWLK